MQNRRRTVSWLLLLILWVVIALVLLIPTLYFVNRFGDQAFLDGTLGNLFATMIGLIAGIPIALEINRRQEKQQAKAEYEKKLQEDRDRLHVILERIQLELTDNQERVSGLQDVLSNSRSARLDVWEWAITIVNSFSFYANEDLISSGLQRHLAHKKEDSIYQSYKCLRDLLHKVRQAASAHNFFYGHSADEQRVNTQREEIKDFANVVQKQLEDTIPQLS